MNEKVELGKLSHFKVKVLSFFALCKFVFFSEKRIVVLAYSQGHDE